LGEHAESKMMKKDSCTIENSEKHQAAKCQDYNIHKAPVTNLPFPLV